MIRCNSARLPYASFLHIDGLHAFNVHNKLRRCFLIPRQNIMDVAAGEEKALAFVSLSLSLCSSIVENHLPPAVRG